MYFVSRFECRKIKTARIGTSSRCNFRLSVSTDYRSFYCLFILFKVGWKTKFNFALGKSTAIKRMFYKQNTVTVTALIWLIFSYKIRVYQFSVSNLKSGENNLFFPITKKCWTFIKYFCYVFYVYWMEVHSSYNRF